MSKQSLHTWKNRRSSISYWISVGLGSGLFRPAPGTWGSFAGLLLAVLFIKNGITLFGLGIAILIVSILGSVAIDKVEKLSGIHDAPEIVIDEIAGQWIAVLPILMFAPSWIAFALAFILFRLFDIVKPWPISWLDSQVQGGFGVMVDDIVAGIQAAFILYAMFFFQLI
ncbi:phosphatidylglycerophosphatase A [Kordiimonas sediminis]|uniref:Phosphatidylglycerophosphatase A n=1 Tax=Kordiimonas sediminis TaxID=1735581 RepID=A0A919AXK3_9PROT|nr:phosphatidylglycerophosphatase A [Kordiimonas sediminis]GHF28261.1 phosphatidylglycerophosphatase A [Kordiimonas sediminis]